ncbi:MAG: hypothetical protein G01um101420_714 [Parcubacteria group bacterium Gr01-1014_20]|nr:MAG: hypothetical protein G01um101420_714 [Parcubacteria group bacterium Gr01-1014_20]
MKKRILFISVVCVLAGTSGFIFLSKEKIFPEEIVSINPDDQACLSDIDCVVIAKNCDHCGTALNKFSLPRYEKGAIKFCPDYAKTSSCETPNPKCLSGICVLSLPKPQASLPLYTIRQINTISLLEGTYNTEAQVRSIYECPPCPTGKFCATCLEPHVFLMQGKNIPTAKSYQINDNQLVAFIHNPKELTRGLNYRFSIQIPKDYKFDGTYDTSYKNNLKIVAYELINP